MCRADVLEPALAERPGRVDQAVEIGLPDEAARRRLFTLYSAGLDASAVDLDVVASRTEGTTASFTKELVRRAALMAAERDVSGSGAVHLDDEAVAAALDELDGARAGLTRRLLGGGTGAGDGDVGHGPGQGPRHGPGWFGDVARDDLDYATDDDELEPGQRYGPE